MYSQILYFFQHLASLLIVTQLLGQIFESVVPYLVYKRRKKEIQTKAKDVPEGIEPLTPNEGIDEATRLHAETEAAKEEFTVSVQYPLRCFMSCICPSHIPAASSRSVSQNLSGLI